MSVDVTDQSVDTTAKTDAKPAIFSADLARRVGAEFIGTFVLVFTVVATVLTQQPLAPLAIGAALMISIYAGGHISGAHFNPAVTIAVWVRGRLPIAEVAPYILSQFVGAAAAAAVGVYVVNPTANTPGAFTDARTTLSALRCRARLHLRSRLRRPQRCDQQGQRRQLVLRSRNRLHRRRRCVRSGWHQRWRLQPGRRPRCLDRRPLRLVEHLGSTSSLARLPVRSRVSPSRLEPRRQVSPSIQTAGQPSSADRPFVVCADPDTGSD